MEKILKGLPATSNIQRRAAKDMAVTMLETPPQIAFQHSVLCQTSLPYRDPGPEVRVWERKQGAISLRINAGEAKNPKTGEWVPLGLPCGPKPRLILAHLNAEALKTGSPEIDVEASLTSFVKRVQKYAPNGREITAYKDQLSRLATATIRMAMTTEDRVFQMNNHIVSAFDLLIKEKLQRVLWPTTLHLSLDYFASLQKHAVPLDEIALGGLSHSTMALDTYAWLAQRLHRVPRKWPQFISWAALKGQFGEDYQRIRKFREVFNVALKQVLLFYPTAKVSGDRFGLTLRNSPSPIKKRMVLVDNPCG